MIRITHPVFHPMIPPFALLSVWVGSCITVAHAQFPQQHVTYLSRSDSPQGVGHEDVWGYVSPEGREVAILGRNDGLSFIDTTDPYNPVLLRYIPGAGGPARDMCTFGHYCFMTAEGFPGTDIIDLSDLNDIKVAKHWGNQYWSHSHTMTIDPTAGIMYVNGTDAGMNIVDINQPLKPVHLASYYEYVHDSHAANGLAHLSVIRAGQYRILDVTSPAQYFELDRVQTPGGSTHTTWADISQTLGITCDETSKGHLTLYDISNPADIRYLSEFRSPVNETIHNAYVAERVIHCAWYGEGYVAIDALDPRNPRFAGGYKTGLTPGCYPFQPSGSIYMASVNSGLWVLRLDPFEFHPEPFADTLDEHGPYRIKTRMTRILEESPDSLLRICWSTDRDPTERCVPMRPTGIADEYFGEIPGQEAPCVVRYHFGANNGARAYRSPDAEENTFAFRVGEVTAIFADDLEAGAAGWSHGSGAGSDDFALGGSDEVSTDPDAAFSGANVWGTSLAGAAVAGSERWLRSPAIDPSGNTGLRLRYRRWLGVRSAPQDLASILINGRIVWTNGFSPNGRLVDHDWMLHDLDISKVADSAPSVQVEFRLRTGSAPTLGGWNIDDVEVYSLRDIDSTPPPSILVSFAQDATVSGFDGAPISTQADDVLLYDASFNAFAPLLDASDVGLSKIAAFHWEASGSFLFSFSRVTTIPGLSGGPAGDLVEPCDIVRFNPSSLGDNTAGSFDFYFDGSDVGLSGNKIDAIGKNGVSLFMSLRLPGVIGGVGNVGDEDLLRFQGFQTGANTSGQLFLHLDGSAVGLDTAAEGVDGLGFSGELILLSTRGNFDAGGLQGQDDDIVIFDPLALTFSLLLDGLIPDIQSLDIDSLDFVGG